MTHEEVFTTIARNELRSYKQLPQVWYQIQVKFRDEARPKSGLMRLRTFIMKDAYTFDVDKAGLGQIICRSARSLQANLYALRHSSFRSSKLLRVRWAVLSRTSLSPRLMRAKT